MQENWVMKDKQDIGRITLPTHGGGFFSNFFLVLDHMMTCYHTNLKPYVDLSNSAFLEGYNPYTDTLPANTDNVWDWWFEQEQPTDEDNVIDVQYSPRNFGQDKVMWKRDNMPFARAVGDLNIHIRPHILKQAEEHYNNLLKDRVSLGVMARGCEFSTYHRPFGNQTIETWISYTENILKLHPEINTIFFVTEDSHYIPIYLQKFPDAIYLKDVFRRTTESLSYMVSCPLWPVLTQPRENHCRILGEECLVQALLLGRCDYLLCKQCGTSSGAIYYATDNLKDVYYAD